MHVSPWNLILQTVNFVVLFWLLHRFLFAPVRRVIDARQAEVASRLARAAAKQSEAEQLIAQYQQKLADIGVESEREMKRARERADEDAGRIRADADRSVRETRDRALHELARERQLALEELKTHALELAISIAQKLLREAGPGEDDAFLSHAMAAIDALPSHELCVRIEALASSPVEVVSARSLSEHAREHVARWLAELAGHPVGVTFMSDDALLAGVQIRIAHSTWEFNLRASLARIRTELNRRDAA